MARKSSVRARAKSKRAGAQAGRPSIPKLLFAQASPHSIGGMSMFDMEGPVGTDVVSNFMSDTDLLTQSAQALQDAGFQVLQISAYTINIAAPIATYERAFKTKVVPEELETIKSQGVTDTATFFTVADAPRYGLITTAGTAFENLIEGVAIETPRYFFATQPMPPKKAYWHLQVPHDISLGCNADKAHRSGITGRNVKVAMVDSGHFAHPFFAARGYRVQPVTLGPGAINPSADDNGHGTAESANIFAVAPDAELWPVKINFANSTGAFNAAVGLSPQIITCSWGSDVRAGPLSAANQTLAVAIADAVARGIVVVFSTGNGQHGFPGQHPDVISAGGVFRDPNGNLRASDYASGFTSRVYPGRNAPDLCGLVGMKPRAAYIMLPLQPGSEIDTSLATGGPHPNSDETAANDGWAAISGTSAAAPQLAGTAALIKQACPALDPAAVRDIMVRTAIDVTTGNSNTTSGGAAAGPGTDLATGAGLVDANAAVLVAKVRCLGPVRPITPPVLPPTITPPVRPPITPPITPPVRPPIRPPIRPPVTPVLPVAPVRPPVTPVVPVRPITPVRPVQPIEPIVATPASETAADDAPATTDGVLSHEDVQALEDMVVRKKIDPLK
jgi:hypothetical protein